MGMSLGGGGGRRSLNSDINVTPMLDVLLVLLIVFMVTAPMMQTGVDLELPQAEASVIQDEEGKLILSIDKAGDLFLGQTKVPWEELEEKLSSNAKVKADGELYIEADTNLPYGTVLRSMAIARKAGVIKLMMLTDPLDEGAPTKPAGVPGAPGAAPGGTKTP
jgi:biopolymer transport protein TolR